MTNLNLHLDSRDSIDPANPSKAVWNLNHIAKSVHADADIIVQSVSIPNAVYPINANNNQIVFTDSGGTSTITMLPQHYTYSQFQTQLETNLNADATLAQTYTVSYDTQLRKFSISATGNFVIDEGNGLAFLIGYTQHLPTSSTSPHAAEAIARLDGSAYVNVLCPQVIHSYSAKEVSRILAHVPLPQFGVTSTMTYGAQFPVRLSHSALSSLKIQLRDEFNRPWVLPKNSHISISLRITSGSISNV